MEDVILYCPNCHGRLLSSDVEVGGEVHRLMGEEFYCPSCEMFTAPDPNPPIAHAVPEEVNPADSPKTPVHSARGTNAGGSQSGDLSDQGAAQWYRDPRETDGRLWNEEVIQKLDETEH